MERAVSMKKPRRVFLLSPANTGGLRGAMLMRDDLQFDLGKRLHGGVATIGEVYAFISGLYFRGKIAYASAFPSPPGGVPASLLIVPGARLVPPARCLSIERPRAIS